MGDEGKKYYWIKLKTDFFDIPTIDWLMEQQDGCAYVVLYQKLCLLTANQGGALVRQIGEMIIPYEPKKIAEVTKFSINTVAVALELYKRLGLIYINEDGIMILAGVDTMVGSESANANAQRQKRFRERQKKDALPKDESEALPEPLPEALPEALRKVTPEVTEGVTPGVTENNEEYRDKSLESRVQSLDKDPELEKEKKKKKKEKAPAKAAASTPDFTGTTFSSEMRARVEAWIQYKSEKRQGYQPTGLQALITVIQNNVTRYGEKAVYDLIGACMAANYQGIIFDRLKGLPEVRAAATAEQGEPATMPETNNEFARLRQRLEGMQA